MKRTLILSVFFLCCASADAQDASPLNVEVFWQNGDIRLAGTLSIPDGEGPFPAVVIVHGSGTSSRSNPWTAAWSEALVARGMAVLHPDKRGSGDSEGDWRSATFTDLADDLVPAVGLLAEHPLIDPDRIGLIGFSQGGHILPLAASRDDRVSLLVDVSGGVVPMGEQIGDEIRRMGLREGLDQDGVDMISHIHDLSVRYAMTGSGWDVYLEALDKAKAGRYGQTDAIQGFPEERDSWVWAFLKGIADYDPLPFWKQVDVPVLFLYGGRDENVDVFKSVDLIEEQLTPTGLAYSLLLFRNNGHGLFREDAMDFIARWIRDGGVD